jgi:hypothetical protein
MRFFKLKLMLVPFLFFISLNCVSDLGGLDPTCLKKNCKRSCMTIRELNWAGSVRNDGFYDPDDDFIEIYNEECGIPVDLTGFQFQMEGSINRTYIIPESPGDKNIIEPQELKTIIAKADGAFQKNPDNNYDPIILPQLNLPDKNFSIETFTVEDFLMENKMNNEDGYPLGGAYDGYTSHSMEKTEDKFDEEGGAITSWHSSTPCNEAIPGTNGIMGTACANPDNDDIGFTGTNVHENYVERTFATPGEVNTMHYY